MYLEHPLLHDHAPLQDDTESVGGVCCWQRPRVSVSHSLLITSWNVRESYINDLEVLLSIPLFAVQLYSMPLHMLCKSL